MAKVKVSGAGRMGSMSNLKKTLKKSAASQVRIIPKEDSLTVRILEEPEEFYGYYEHYVDQSYKPCVEGDCDGCNSDDPDERRKTFRYLANCYVVDDQKVQLVKFPKTLVEQLAAFFAKYGTLRDRDYELSRTGSGQNDTKYMAVPDGPSKVKLSRFESKMLDPADVVSAMVNDDEDDEDEVEPLKKSKKKKEKDPWDDVDDEPKKSKKKTTTTKARPTVKKRTTTRKITRKN